MLVGDSRVISLGKSVGNLSGFFILFPCACHSHTLLLVCLFVYHFKQIQSRLYLEISIQAATVFFKEAIMFASSWQILGLVLFVFAFWGSFVVVFSILK